MLGYVRLVNNKGAAVSKRMFTSTGKSWQEAHGEILKLKSAWEQNAPHLCDGGLRVVDDIKEK